MSTGECLSADLDIARRARALQAWVEDCRARMRARWPEVDFDSDHWQLNTKYKTRLQDVSFAPALADFNGRDPAYGLALKCLMAGIALKGDVKVPHDHMRGWRLLSRVEVPLHQLRRAHLRGLEDALVEQAQTSPSSAGSLTGDLSRLRAHVDVTGAQGVTDRMAWSLAPQTKARLRAHMLSSREQFKTRKALILDRQIEALSDAQMAMLKMDARLSAYDRVALAVMGLNMCCPNRVNEPLCMALDDRFMLEDYMTRDADSRTGVGNATLDRVHQMLLVKGSKGGAWGAKPILNFMIAFADLCIQIIKRHGERSRMLVTWYEKHPDILYLPAALEQLRGTEITRFSLWQITRLASEEPRPGQENCVDSIWKEMHREGLIHVSTNPRACNKNGTKNKRTTIQTVAWSDLEPTLLARVKQAMENVRKVTRLNNYEGRLSNMLMLFDNEQTPYLPSSITYGSLARRLIKRAYAFGLNREPEPTLFEKLDIKMVVNGVVKTAYINTHDPRRWLTTQALDSSLPDVLANKWANRISISQLKDYDLRSAERKAEQAAMPDLKELGDMTRGLLRLGALESEYGLKTQVVAVGDANIAVASMNEIMRATEDRPVARTSNQIIILYPQRYGVCLHQHHERPCRSYKCAPCNEGVVVKGHLPTNERVREDADLIFRSIVNQLEALLIARDRQLADNPDTLDEHIFTLVREGLKPEIMAKELLARFHEINDLIKDRSFANKLAEAFALTGYVQQLDEERNRPGALIKYHNPSHHAAPGHERALEARHGGRAGVKITIKSFEHEYPQFAQTELCKQDQRDLMETDEDDMEGSANDD